MIFLIKGIPSLSLSHSLQIFGMKREIKMPHKFLKMTDSYQVQKLLMLGGYFK
jgi:hypothetical protein